jgi:hypothetical protein
MSTLSWAVRRRPVTWFLVNPEVELWSKAAAATVRAMPRERSGSASGD